MCAHSGKLWLEIVPKCDVVVERFVKWFGFSVLQSIHNHNLVLDTFLNSKIYCFSVILDDSYCMSHTVWLIQYDSTFTAWERPINLPIKTRLIELRSDFQFSISDPLAKWPKATKLGPTVKLKNVGRFMSKKLGREYSHYLKISGICQK